MKTQNSAIEVVSRVGFGRFQASIDADLDPYIPEGWRLVKHVRPGFVAWKPGYVRLFRTDSWKNVGSELAFLENIDDRLPHNATVLDFLLRRENQHLIPEGLQRYHVWFPGTVYEADSLYNDPNYLRMVRTCHTAGEDRRCMRGICYVNGAWKEHRAWLISSPSDKFRIALRSLEDDPRRRSVPQALRSLFK
ncbi:MAG: hypothetical protein KGI79_01630 [Patescibacteria group bacterium]|nr:hypothetical protein [Patescibacteria group bacterium]MDE2116557.1 hypothetical protein [Patescibacteria group bacterium]